MSSEVSVKRNIRVQIDNGKLFDLEDSNLDTVLLILDRLPSIARERYISIMHQLANAREKLP